MNENDFYLDIFFGWKKVSSNEEGKTLKLTKTYFVKFENQVNEKKACD